MNARKLLGTLAGLAGMVMSTTASAAIGFAPVVNYPTGSAGGPGPAAEAMVATDLDNDGDADIVMADWWGTGIRAMLNNGSGGFGPAIVTTLGTSTGSVGAGDFDGDGKADIAVATGMQLIILRGLGNGQFTEVERQTLTVSGQVQAYVFDTNNDAKLDIVAPTPGGVRTFLGQGDGHFVSGPLSPVYTIISSTARGNFNNDGVTDIAVIDDVAQRAIIMRGNGDGSFTEMATAFLGFISEDITAGDLNGDGIDDLASADSFSFTMSVVLSNGLGGFQPTKRYFGIAGPVGIRMADFDRDGDRDIVVSAVVSSQLMVYSNNGSGSFGSPLNLSVTNQPQTPVVADYNRDGKQDIAVAGAGGQLSILRNTSP
ncbi:MAG TPA: VCBS repeat-containing protein [Solimonas sp.]|nr:VCBS repeat-containing protein [Solimonas sp.]